MTRREAFESLYRSSSDPWSFESSWYERRKHALTLAALPQQRYGRGFEPGCSIGVLSAMLAPRCDTLLAADISARAVELAHSRLADFAGVTIERLDLPDAWPAGPFDLVVVSELGYFLTHDELDRLIERAAATLAAGGDLVAVNWRGPIDGYPLDGADVHERVRAAGLRTIVHHTEDDFLLEVFRA